jgi:hypothetical protein
MKNVKNQIEKKSNDRESLKETIEKMKKSLNELKTEDYMYEADDRSKNSNQKQNNNYLNEKDKLIHIKLIKELEYKKRP